MARPQLEGVVRYANNRINQAETRKIVEQLGKVDRDKAPPSPRIMRERQMFNAKCFKGGNQAQHAGDAIGRLWLVGRLDIKGYDESKLLSAARMWWKGREETFKDSGFASQNFERVSRTSNAPTAMTKMEKVFRRYESFLWDADDYDAKMLHDLMQPYLDGQPCLWAERIVQTEVLRHFVLPIAMLSCARDDDNLDAAKRALLAMAGAEAMVKSDAA